MTAAPHRGRAAGRLLLLATLSLFAAGPRPAAAGTEPGPGGPASPSAGALLAGLPRLAGPAGLARLAAAPATSAHPEATTALATGPGEAEAVPAAAGVVVLGLAEGLPAAAAAGGAGRQPAGPAVAAALSRLAASGAGPVAWAPWRPGPAPAADPLARVALVFYDGPLGPAAAARLWARRPGVEFAEPYYLHHPALVPDDPLLPQQPYLGTVRAREGWDLARGEDAGVIVAVVDGGIDITHPDLAANVLVNLADPPGGGDQDGNGFIDDYRGWNFARGNDDPADLPAASLLHGTHVAGLVDAVTDNAIGIAGLSWNAPLLCVAAGSATEPDIVRFGYQGLLYAAERGAGVINCSWGRSGTASSLEAAVLARVRDLGALVVAAAGNEGDTVSFYPAAYRGVVAVANVTMTGAPHFTTNRGPWVDLAAPGVGLLSLAPGGGTAALTGTSMSSPLVAGCATLLLGARPELDAAAAGLGLRLGCAPLPSSWAEGLGAGMLDVAGILGRRGPGWRLLDLGLEDPDGDGRLTPGQEVALHPLWRNLLDDADGELAVTVSVDSALAEVVQGTAVLPALAAGAEARLDGLRLRLRPDVPVDSRLAVTFDLRSGPDAGQAYHDRQGAEIAILPLLVDLADPRLRLSLAGNGRIGFAGIGGGNGADGIGVRFVPGPEAPDGPGANLLFEGALLVGTGVERISDAARRAADGAFDHDLRPDGLAGLPRRLPLVRLEDGRRLEGAAAKLVDDVAADPLGVEIDWRAFAPPPGGPAIAMVLATVRNVSAAPLAGLRIGFFLDWDLGDGSLFPDIGDNGTAARDAGAWAAAWRESDPEGLTVATALVTEGGLGSIFRAIGNDGSAPGNPSWGIYDGFSDAEKWEALSLPGPQAVGGMDISQFWAAGPRDLAPGDSLRVVLAMGAGRTADEAAAAVAEGREAGAALLAERGWNPPRLPLRIGRPRPNPWNDAVTIPVAGDSELPWRLRVYDLRGRLLRDLSLQLPAAEGTLSWDGRDGGGRAVPSGVYLLRVEQGGGAATREATLIR